MEKEHKGDSNVVNITPATSTFPAVPVLRRKHRREPGKVAQEADLGVFGRLADYQGPAALEELAKSIGLAILNDSPVVAEYRAKAAPND